MKTLGYAVILLLCFALPAHAAQVYTGCAVPPSTFRHVWYFDPVHGKTQAAGGNGSQAAPWNNLQALVQAETGYAYPAPDDRPLSVRFRSPDSPRSSTTGPKAGPIAPGDEILLMSGNYGDLWLSIYDCGDCELRFCDDRGRAGQTPVLTSLFVAETNNWVFNGLKVQSLQSARPQRQRPGRRSRTGARRFRRPTLCSRI